MISALGKRIGYWDDLFTDPAIAALLTMCFCLLFIALAVLEWLHSWIACLMDTALGGRTISP